MGGGKRRGNWAISVAYANSVQVLMLLLEIHIIFDQSFECTVVIQMINVV